MKAPKNLPMKAGQKGYLTIRNVKVTTGGLHVRFVEMAKGFRITHCVFQSITGGWKITVTPTYFKNLNAVFTEKPFVLTQDRGPNFMKKSNEPQQHVKSIILKTAAAHRQRQVA